LPIDLGNSRFLYREPCHGFGQISHPAAASRPTRSLQILHNRLTVCRPIFDAVVITDDGANIQCFKVWSMESTGNCLCGPSSAEDDLYWRFLGLRARPICLEWSYT